MYKIFSNKGELWIPYTEGNVTTNTFISNKGRVIKNGIEQCLSDNGNGYYTFIPGCGLRGPRYIHRAVARLFLGDYVNLQVNHIDGNKFNNCLDNLEWVSPSANIKHAHKTGLMKKRTENGVINVLTIEQVIYGYTAVKKYGKQITATANDMGISRTTLSSIINKRSRSDITDNLDKLFENAVS